LNPRTLKFNFIMAEIIPFKGILYNPDKVDGTSVMAPPYDIVTPELREALYDKNPYNIIRIDLGKDKIGDNEEENRYTRASRWLNEWIEQGILIRDSEPSFYCYETSYNPPFTKGGGGGIEKKLRGLIGAVRIEELGSGRIHPHEMTYSKPKADRLNILRFCNANISPIFSLYSGPERITSTILEKVVRGKALIEAKNGDGFIHRLWRINSKTAIMAIKKELADKDIFIADGHHRYETALEFKNEMGGKGEWNYVMMFLANMEDDGLTILPTHRLVKIGKGKKIRESLKPYFDITDIRFDASSEAQAKQEMFRAIEKSKHSVGMFIKGEKAFYVLSFKGSYFEIDSPPSLQGIAVTILHKLIFEKLLGIDEFEYEMDSDLAIERVNNSSFQVVFFLSPTKVQDVKRVALAGQRMPPKSTYFYPKLLTGMVIYKF